MSTQTGLITVEEFLKLPEPKQGHAELHHGEVVTMPPPKWGHQQIQDRIQMLLKRMAIDDSVRMEMAFRPAAEYEVWQADVGLVRSQRARKTGADDYLSGAPDLIVEVLSPSNTAWELNEKMALCLANGCRSFWLVDPGRKQVSVTEGNVTRHYGVTDSVTCAVLPGTIPVREIFE